MKPKKEYLSLREIQNAALEILVEFDRVCRLNGLRYSLAYGTLLGAIRHKGFIPWDDDVDVVMPRPDYERLHDMAERGEIVFPEGYLLSSDRGKKPEYPFMKLMNSAYRISSNTHFEVPYLYLDIFPVDGVVEDEKARKREERHNRTLINESMLSRWPTIAGFWRVPVRIFSFFPYAVLKIFGVRRHAVEKLNRNVRKYPFEKSKECDCTNFGPIRTYAPVGWYDSYEEADFGGHKFMILTHWDEWLTMRYGDYMTPPPKKEQTNQHSYLCWRNV